MPETITGFDPFTTGALYSQHSDRWQLESDVAEMTLDILEAGTYLPEFSKEEQPSDYNYRTSMSAPLDICRDAIRIRMDNMWRAPVNRDVKPTSPHRAMIEELIADADGNGTSLDDFMRQVAWNYYVTGCDIIAQVTRAPEGVEIKTEADRRTHKIKPYFSQFVPLDRYDWACDGSRNFLWARYCLGTMPPEDERGPRTETTTRFLTLTREEWRIYQATRLASDPQGPPTVTLEGSGAYNLGRPPILKCYFSESSKSGQAGVPVSLLSRPAVIAKLLLNVKSQADTDLIAAVPRWLLTGAGPEDTIGAYGPGVLVKLGNPNAKMEVVQGDVNHIAEKRAWVNLYIGEILRLLKFRGGMAEIEAQAGSGLKLAIERTDLDNELRATASFLEQTELEMMRQAVSLATGTVIPAKDAAEILGYDVRYNRDFVLESAGQMLENISTLLGKCGTVADEVPELVREMLRQLKNALVREGTDAAEQIDKEIDAASFDGAAGEVISESDKEVEEE